MERMDHFLLLLVIVAIVNMFRSILLVQFRICFDSICCLITVLAHLRLHVGKMGLMDLLLACKTALQVLAHSDHARKITRRGVNMGSLIASLKLIETTRTPFALIMEDAILNASSLERLLRVDAWECSILLHRLRVGATRSQTHLLLV